MPAPSLFDGRFDGRIHAHIHAHIHGRVNRYSHQMRHVKSRNSGFTLIEIMVVLIIIGIMTGLVALNVSTGGPEKAIKKEALRFKAVVSYAVDIAAFQQQELGIVVEDDGYKFIRWGTPPVPPPATPPVVPPPPPPENRWLLVSGDNTLREYTLPEGILFKLDLEESEFVKIVGEDGTTNGDSVYTRTSLDLDDIGPDLDDIGPVIEGEEEEVYEPSVYILSSGEMTPFISEFFLKDDKEIKLNCLWKIAATSASNSFSAQSTTYFF